MATNRTRFTGQHTQCTVAARWRLFTSADVNHGLQWLSLCCNHVMVLSVVNLDRPNDVNKAQKTDTFLGNIKKR